jgi:regulator of protease activity HflC (stomatin/prohibitin superfamily)
MNPRLNALAQAARSALASGRQGFAGAAAALNRSRSRWAMAGLAAAGAYALWLHPPVQTVARGEMAVRTNRFTGQATELREGAAFVAPGIHELRRYALRDQVYQPGQGDRAPFQSIEGLSIGVDMSVRYALDPAKLAGVSRDLPADVGAQLVQPAVEGAVYRIFARYTVREIFSSKRAEIQQAIEAELKPKLAADGVLLRSVQVGKVALPADYRSGMDKLLAEELETEKMRYTLVLKEKRVQETALDGDAERVRREKAAQAAASEQLIAARAQEDAMKHVLPLKQKQIEQRQLEAEAERQARIRIAEGAAAARRIEASGEAESRQKLADAEAYRLDRVGRIASEQMARDGALVSKHPLLIQKTLADKLSDKITVIVAPPPADGGFIGAGLVGAMRTAALPAGTANEAASVQEEQ